jgi:hypothetical protein
MAEMRRFPVGREGTVARSKLRTVASAGTLAAFLLVGGAAVPVVSADPGHSRDGNGSDRGSDSRHGDSRRGDGDGRHGQGGAERGRDDGGWQRGGDSRGPDRTNDPSYPNSAVGAGRTAELNPNRTEVASRAGTTARSDQVVTDSSVSRRSVTGEVTTATVIPEEPALPAVPIRPVAGGGGSGAAAVAAPGGSPVTAPSVTIGNGRSPGILTGRPDDAPSRAGVDPAVAGPAMTPAVVTPQLQPPDRLDVPPPQRAVAILWAAAAPGQPGGVLFGLVGLILAPIAGAWLGYRQARASRAAANLVPR